MSPVSPTPPMFVTSNPRMPRAIAAEPPRVRGGLERMVDAMDRPNAAPVHGRMASADFIETLGNYDATLARIAESDAKPNSSEASELAMTKTAGSTVNAIFFGAPNRAMRAMEAPDGSHELLHNAVSGGVRLLAAAVCMTTVFIPVVAGVVGFARGGAASTRKGVVRQYKRHMMQDQVLDPLKKTLAASPTPASAGDRAAVQALLTTCKKNKKVARIVRSEDLKGIKTWLADHPLK